MRKQLVFIMAVLFMNTVSVLAQEGESNLAYLGLDLTVSEVKLKDEGGEGLFFQSQEVTISCKQYLLPATDEVTWNSVIGYYFSQDSIFDSMTAILLAETESSLGGRSQDYYDPEEATMVLPDALGIGYIHVVADHLRTFSAHEKGGNNVVTLEIAIKALPNGIAEEVMDNSVTLYPNPTTDVLNIKSPVAKQGQVFKIFNTSGSVVKTVPSGYGSTLTIDVSDLVAGIYFVNESELKMQKFVKL